MGRRFRLRTGKESIPNDSRQTSVGVSRPCGDVQGSWRAMEELHVAGKIRAVGVSNFDKAQFANLMAGASAKPAINQVETHPFLQEKEQFEWLHADGVRMEAWAPFAEGRNGIFANPVLEEISKKHGKTRCTGCSALAPPTWSRRYSSFLKSRTSPRESCHLRFLVDRGRHEQDLCPRRESQPIS